MATFTHIKFGDNLDVTDEGAGTIRVDGAGGVGPAGAAGATGPAGPGVPAGGTTGQQLVKTSATDYATNWATPAAAGAAGGVLSGTYPNPGFAADMATQAELDAAIQQPAARTNHNGTQSIPNNAETVLGFATGDRFDQAHGAASTIHDLVTLNSRLTCREAGIYQITGQATFAGVNTTGVRQLRIRHQGATYIGIALDKNPILASDSHLTVTTLYALAVGEYVELMAYQNSGAALNVQASSAAAQYLCEFMMVKVA